MITEIVNPKQNIVKNQALSPSLGKESNIPSNRVYNVTESHQKRSYKLSLLAFAQKLLIDANVPNRKDTGGHRTRYCHSNLAFNSESYNLKLSSDENKSQASIGGVMLCDSVWACPVCSQRIASFRAKEIERAFEWSRREKFLPVMVTLTASHHANMTLESFKESFKRAWAYFASGSTWRNLKARYGIKHSITAREITHGNNGWHYHMHILIFVDKHAILKDGAITEMTLALQNRWIYALHREALDGIDGIACDVKADGKVSEVYLAKLGIEDGANAQGELVGAWNKTKGRTQWQILKNASRGNAQDAKLYIEFVEAMTGDNWITWSEGFKALVGVDEIQDEQVEDMAAADCVAWLDIAPEDFEAVRITRNYSELIDLAAMFRDEQVIRDFLMNEAVRARLVTEMRLEELKTKIKELSRDLTINRANLNLSMRISKPELREQNVAFYQKRVDGISASLNWYQKRVAGMEKKLNGKS